MVTSRTRPPRITPMADGPSLDALDQWLSALDGPSGLDVATERALVRRAQTGDQTAEVDLLRTHGRYAISVARRYQGHGVPLADLVQEANCGLLAGIRKFDLSQDVRLLSYARWWIQQYLQEAVARQGKSISTSYQQAFDARKLQQAREALIARLGRNPTREEVAEESGATVQRVRDLEVLGAVEVDLHGGGTAGESGTAVRLEDRLANEDEQDALEDLATREVTEILEAELATLDPRDARVLRLYFGLDGEEEKTLDAIGAELGVVRERVRQLRERALKRLRQSVRLQEHWEVPVRQPETTAPLSAPAPAREAVPTRIASGHTRR